jgi:hypothetical protein
MKGGLNFRLELESAGLRGTDMDFKQLAGKDFEEGI